MPRHSSLSATSCSLFISFYFTLYFILRHPAPLRHSLSPLSDPRFLLSSVFSSLSFPLFHCFLSPLTPYYDVLPSLPPHSPLTLTIHFLPHFLLESPLSPCFSLSPHSQCLISLHPFLRSLSSPHKCPLSSLPSSTILYVPFFLLAFSTHPLFPSPRPLPSPPLNSASPLASPHLSFSPRLSSPQPLLTSASPLTSVSPLASPHLSLSPRLPSPQPLPSPPLTATFLLASPHRSLSPLLSLSPRLPLPQPLTSVSPLASPFT